MHSKQQIDKRREKKYICTELRKVVATVSRNRRQERLRKKNLQFARDALIEVLLPLFCLSCSRSFTFPYHAARSSLNFWCKMLQFEFICLKFDCERFQIFTCIDYRMAKSTCHKLLDNRWPCVAIYPFHLNRGCSCHPYQWRLLTLHHAQAFRYIVEPLLNVYCEWQAACHQNWIRELSTTDTNIMFVASRCQRLREYVQCSI